VCNLSMKKRSLNGGRKIYSPKLTILAQALLRQGAKMFESKTNKTHVSLCAIDY